MKIGKCKFFAFFDFFSIYWNEKISKKTFLSKFRISKKTFFRNFFDFEKSKKNQRMQKNCLFRFLLQKMALSHMMEMSHFARSQCTTAILCWLQFHIFWDTKRVFLELQCVFSWAIYQTYFSSIAMQVFSEWYTILIQFPIHNILVEENTKNSVCSINIFAACCSTRQFWFCHLKMEFFEFAMILPCTILRTAVK